MTKKISTTMFLSFALAFTYLVGSYSANAHFLDALSYEESDSNSNPSEGRLLVKTFMMRSDVSYQCKGSDGTLGEWITTREFANYCEPAASVKATQGCVGCEVLEIHRDGCGELYEPSITFSQPAPSYNDDDDTVTVTKICKHYYDSPH